MDDKEVGGREKGGVTGRRRRAVGILIAGLLFAGPANAQFAVVDMPHTIKTILGWIAQYQQMWQDYQSQIDQLSTLDKQYQQALVSGVAYEGSPGHREQFSQRGLDDGLADRCGATPRNNPAGADQHMYCSAIVTTENRRFNAMVAMLEDVEERDRELRAAYAERAGIGADEQGKLASNTNRILAIQGQLQNDVQNAETLLGAYDATLVSLQADQVRAANKTLGGSGGDQLMQGVALKLALRAARTRER
jgi:hypothetical protein